MEALLIGFINSEESWKRNQMIRSFVKRVKQISRNYHPIIDIVGSVLVGNITDEVRIDMTIDEIEDNPVNHIYF